MDEACAKRKGAMLALLGADETLATKVASSAAWEVANLNGAAKSFSPDPPKNWKSFKPPRRKPE